MKPRILLVEDDPTTRAFLAAAAESLPAEVDAVASAAQARACCARHRHALWLLDAHLPDSDGASLLAELQASCDRAPALAHTASRDPALLEALLGAGFIEVLVKPVSTADLHAAMRRALGTGQARVAESRCLASIPAGAGVWDDGAALAALNGQPTHVSALRGLFLAELPGVRDQVADAAARNDAAALRALLHRLKASCGFVGAARIAAAVAMLEHATDPAEALPGFQAAVQETLSSA
ncbi:response regulator [Luteimonas vadosa]|uniref:Response regulator n=1 Tax=Luteimonas vadosa TaxID=1165507 RepID=A0ABP9DXA3_9GAMM